jgi:hypothetical protein
MACLLVAPHARANEFDDFQRARSAYEALDYDLAADLFEGLVGGEVPSLTNRSLVVESRKYYAAALLFLGKLEEADAQVRLLLDAEPDYVLDPLAFPEEFQRLFQRVRSELARKSAQAEAERARQAQETAAREASADERDRERTARHAKLVLLASTERVQERRSRWIALLPFGVGQFQNGHDSLGLAFAIAEGTLLATAVTSFWLHENLRDQNPAADRLSDAQLAEKAFRYTNHISSILFVVVTAAGIADAQLRFRGDTWTERRRPIAPELLELSFGISPNGASVRGTF